MRVLFLNDGNGFETQNPIADLVDVFNTSEIIMKFLEDSQYGVRRFGGNWKEILKDGKISHNIISSGRLSDFNREDYDIIYKLISGNY